MQYLLEAIRRNSGTVEITDREFAEISTAKRSLVIAIGFEEKFYLLLENYAEFERALLDLTLRRLVFADSDWSNFQDDILTVNRRLANLLSAARSYLDQVDHELVSLFGDGSASVTAVRTARGAEYDRRLGYRAMEALRNYLQHRSFPVHNLSFGMQRDEVGSRTFAAHTIVPSVSVAELSRDGGLKPGVLEELVAKGPMVSLTPLVREYVEALARVHTALRTAVAEEVAQWEENVRVSIERARNGCGDSNIGFVAVARGEDAEVEEVQLFAELINRRKLLERKGHHTTMLANHYVSGRVPNGDA